MEEQTPKAGNKTGAAAGGESSALGELELAEVLEGIAGVRVSGPSDPQVSSIACDSR
jgi:hypothetical protein